MAYQKKYYFQFCPLRKSETHTVEIWQDTDDTITAEEIKGGVSPFVVQIPNISHLFQVVRGSGCELNLFSDSDMKFFSGLKHTDPREFKVLHYIDSTLNWIGFLNSEMYSEPYDFDRSYIIRTTGNDGFSLMDRFRFLQSDESKYVGLKSEWELLQICLDKIGLEYNDIRIKLATTFDNFSGDSDSTILHETYVNAANFYDEDGKAMTLREVLDSILAPYGAFIKQSEGSIYITDNHTLAGGGSVTYQKFNASTYAYIENVTVVTEKAISDIKYAGTGQSIERNGGVNRQVIRYSPYPTKEILNSMIVTPDEFSTVPSSFSDNSGGYKYRTLETHPIWEKQYLLSTFEESCASLTSERFVYFNYPTPFSNQLMLALKDPSDIFLSITGAGLGYYIQSTSNRRGRRYLEGVSLLITADILAKVTDNPYTDFTDTEKGLGADNIMDLSIRYSCRIGDKYYNQSTDSWTTTAITNNYISTYQQNNIPIGNSWVDLGPEGKGLLIYLGGSNVLLEEMFYGEFDFQLWSDTKIRIGWNDYSENDSLLQAVWVKNLIVSVVNRDGSEIVDNDTEYVGLLNPLYSKEGEEITLTTGSTNQYADKGRLLWKDGSNYLNIDEWTRAGQTYKIEELLLASVCSNYSDDSISLNSMKLKNNFSRINVLTDSSYIANKVFYIIGGTIDYYENVFYCTLEDISEDDLTIVK